MCQLEIYQPNQIHKWFHQTSVPSRLNKRAKHEVMDKVMKMLGIKIDEKNGTNVISVVKCNVEGKLVSGGKSKWLS